MQPQSRAYEESNFSGESCVGLHHLRWLLFNNKGAKHRRNKNNIDLYDIHFEKLTGLIFLFKEILWVAINYKQSNHKNLVTESQFSANMHSQPELQK